MKKILTAVFIAFCFMGSVFAKTYNIKADNDEINIKNGDKIIIELSENPSTGYSCEDKQQRHHSCGDGCRYQLVFIFLAHNDSF